MTRKRSKSKRSIREWYIPNLDKSIFDLSRFIMAENTKQYCSKQTTMEVK